MKKLPICDSMKVIRAKNEEILPIFLNFQAQFTKGSISCKNFLWIALYIFNLLLFCMDSLLNYTIIMNYHYI